MVCLNLCVIPNKYIKIGLLNTSNTVMNITSNKWPYNVVPIVKNVTWIKHWFDFSNIYLPHFMILHKQQHYSQQSIHCVLYFSILKMTMLNRWHVEDKFAKYRNDQFKSIIELWIPYKRNVHKICEKLTINN